MSSLSSQWAGIAKALESISGGDLQDEILKEFGEGYTDEMFRQMPLMDSDQEPYEEHSKLYKTIRENAIDLGISKFTPAQPAMVLSGEAHQRDRFSFKIVGSGERKHLEVHYDDDHVEYMRYHLGEGANADGSGGVPHTRGPIKSRGKALGPIGIGPGGPIFRTSVGSARLPIRRWWGPRDSAFAAGMARAERKLENVVEKI